MRSFHIRLLAYVTLAGVISCSDGGGGASDRGGEDSEGPADAAGDADGGLLEMGRGDSDGDGDAGPVSDGGPDIEGLFGDACERDTDCLSGYCVEGPGGRVCTELCLDICPEGWDCRYIVNSGDDAVQICLPHQDVLCAACSEDSQCGGLSNLCLDFGGGGFCGLNCEVSPDACPEGYVCEEFELPDREDPVFQCLPESGTCSRCLDLDRDGFGDGPDCSGTDCDDTDPQVFSGRTEGCDGVDNDCDGDIDEGEPGSGARCDSDEEGICGPGLTLCESGTLVCVPERNPEVEVLDELDNDCDGVVDDETTAWDDDGDGYCETAPCLAGGQGGGDCSDSRETVHPGADEDGGAGTGLGDGVDNDCDGEIDEGTLGVDDDGDGFCDATDTCRDGSLPGDCDDADDLRHPGADERANEMDDDCDGVDDEGTLFFDDDGDGLTETEGDCDDASGAIHPGAEEERNEVDDDCDGDIDDGTTAWDDDGDGYCESAPCQGGALGDGDCDDAQVSVHPGASEDGASGGGAANGVDDDCDGVVDEGTTASDDDGDGYCESLTSCLAGAAPGDCDDTDELRLPGATERPNDLDDDCDGEVDEGTAIGDDDGDGYSESDGDCDDSDSFRYPGAEERENGLDDDCDGPADEGTALYDDDADGFCEGPGSCSFGARGPGDCDDARAAANPDAPETLNGLDDDCDGDVDDETQIWDDDGDGFCEIAPCAFGAAGGDCNDADERVSPSATESRNGEDDDCDDDIDEGTTAWDDDMDGFCEVGPCVSGIRGEGDCDDARPEVYPGAPEDGGSGDDRADGFDNDCDGGVDEGTLDVDDDRDGYSEIAGDCDDSRDFVAPDGVEIVDGFDNDCDGIIDNGTDVSDDDLDGYSEIAGDCDDGASTVFPGAPEDGGTGSGLPDGLDNDCDGLVDEMTVAADDDLDGFCELAPCAVAGVLPGDCRDNNPNVNPARLEVCANSVDDDCDGTIDVVDNDRDGSVSTSCGGADCNDGNAAVHPGAVEVRDGLDNDCDATGFADEGGLVQAGDIVISEILADPDVVADAAGEWIELHNTTDTPIDLRGWRLADDDTDGHTIAASVVVLPHRSVTLGNNADAGSNGGLSHAYVYSSFILANGADEVRLSFEGTPISGVAWTNAPTAGTSRQLDSRSFAQGAVIALSDFCNTPIGFNYQANNRGTPQATNVVCAGTAPTIGWVEMVRGDLPGPIAGGVPGGGETFEIVGTRFGGATSVTVGGAAAAFSVLDNFRIRVTTPAGAPGLAAVAVTTPGGTDSRSDVFRFLGALSTLDDCRLLAPSTVSGLASTPTPVVLGAVSESGLTGSIGPAPGIIGQIGWGPSVEPSVTAGWTWTQATWRLDSGGEDVHSGVMVPDAVGTWSFALRFSGDEGANWRYCDLSGADWSLAETGVLTVE